MRVNSLISNSSGDVKAATWYCYVNLFSRQPCKAGRRALVRSKVEVAMYAEWPLPVHLQKYGVSNELLILVLSSIVTLLPILPLKICTLEKRLTEILHVLDVIKLPLWYLFII